MSSWHPSALRACECVCVCVCHNEKKCQTNGKHDKRVCACVFERVCARASEHACLHACVCACIRAYIYFCWIFVLLPCIGMNLKTCVVHQRSFRRKKKTCDSSAWLPVIALIFSHFAHTKHDPRPLSFKPAAKWRLSAKSNVQETTYLAQSYSLEVVCLAFSESCRWNSSSTALGKNVQHQYWQVHTHLLLSRTRKISAIHAPVVGFSLKWNGKEWSWRFGCVSLLSG